MTKEELFNYIRPMNMINTVMAFCEITEGREQVQLAVDYSMDGSSGLSEGLDLEYISEGEAAILFALTMIEKHCPDYGVDIDKGN